MVDNHFADVRKMGTMSLTLALIVLDRLNATERIDVARDNLAEAVQMSGYAALPAAEQITVGYQTLAANAAGKAAVSENGRELLVIDSTATQVGVIL